MNTDSNNAEMKAAELKKMKRSAIIFVLSVAVLWLLYHNHMLIGVNL
jgi:hypothetical protein